MGQFDNIIRSKYLPCNVNICNAQLSKVGQPFNKEYTVNLATQIELWSAIPYKAKQWQGKTLANQSFQSFGEENVGKFKLLTFS